jgi:Fe-Mn family superoxide dismutase
MFTQYQLPYEYTALEPVLDALTVETHYAKHHATYTKTLNELAEKAGVQDTPIEDLLSNLDSISDSALRNAIKNNGGGFYNHNLYFSVLSPKGQRQATGLLAKKIDETFGSFDSFKEQISKLALTQFGSGWAWLSVSKDGSLILSQSANQDNPFSLKQNAKPIFCIDVWEHAYYLKYKNLRANYINDLFNIVDWDTVAKNYESAC